MAAGLAALVAVFALITVILHKPAGTGSDRDAVPTSPTETTDTGRVALVGTLAAVCAGSGVSEAAVYVRSAPGPHEMAVVKASGKVHPWTTSVPDLWWPASVDETELVACVPAPARRKIEVCPYLTGPDITRYRVLLTVTVRAARTGKVVGRFTLTDDARECRTSEPYSVTELSGEVTWPMVRKALRPLVVSG